jgi:cysteine desulfuration protein SufE
MMDFDEIIDDLSMIDDWEERYRYIIEMGRTLEPLPTAAYCEANKVRGCASQVWMTTAIGDGPDPVVSFRADSDAYIVKGLVVLLLAAFSEKPASAILAVDPRSFFERTGLSSHLSPQRSNGVASMIARMKADASRALAAA